MLSKYTVHEILSSLITYIALITIWTTIVLIIVHLSVQLIIWII